MSKGDGDDDLDEEFAKFEREIEQLTAETAKKAAAEAAVTTKPTPPPPPPPPPVPTARTRHTLKPPPPTPLPPNVAAGPVIHPNIHLVPPPPHVTLPPHSHSLPLPPPPQPWHPYSTHPSFVPSAPIVGPSPAPLPITGPLPAAAINTAYAVPAPTVPEGTAALQPQPEHEENHGETATASKKKATATVKRTAAGQVWHDTTLEEWPDDDHRLFVGDLAPDATDDELTTAFSKYASFNMARVVKDKRTSNCRGYGFVSFGKASDMLAAIKEMNGKYVGSRPVKLRRSTWKKRSLTKDKWKQVHAFRSISKR